MLITYGTGNENAAVARELYLMLTFRRLVYRARTTAF